MKTIFKLFFSAALIITGLVGSAQCVPPNFNYDVQTGGVVVFTNYSFYADSGGGTTVVAWDFGDGSTSNLSNYQINHTYTTSGHYTVSLRLTNSVLGCDSTVSHSFDINLCQYGARFSYVQTGFGDYTFTPANLSALPGATVLWSFGDGNTSASASPSHHFTGNGPDEVILTVTDAALNCSESDTNGIMLSLCNYPEGIDTTIISYNPVTLGFRPSLTNAGYTYTWAFGDGGTGSGNTVTHSYSASGAYNALLTVGDATTGCSVTVSSSFDLDICGLTAGFGHSGNGVTQYFSAYSYDSTSAIVSSYVWSFPGATPSTATGNQVSGIVYPSTGVYSACVYLTTTGGCHDTLCQSVTITPPVYSISGAASKNSGSGFVGVVYLIKQDTIGHLVLIDSTVSRYDSAQAFNYYFYNLPVDTYFVKAALSPDDADYANFLPTYYGNVLNWGTATPVGIANTDVTGVDIALVAGSNPGGPGFVGGYVNQGAGLIIGNAGNNYAKSLGDPIAGVQVNLLTSTDHAVAYTFTDANGHYKFANLALGSYKIYVEQLNKVPTPLDFTLTTENPVDSGANMSVNSHGTTGIDNVNNLQITEVYPNPVVSLVEVRIGCKQSADVTLKLIDILGRTSLEQKSKLASGQNTVELDMTKLAAGVYQLVIQTGSEQAAYKIVKAK